MSKESMSTLNYLRIVSNRKKTNGLAAPKDSTDMFCLCGHHISHHFLYLNTLPANIHSSNVSISSNPCNFRHNCYCDDFTLRPIERVSRFVRYRLAKKANGDKGLSDYRYVYNQTNQTNQTNNKSDNSSNSNSSNQESDNSLNNMLRSLATEDIEDRSDNDD